MKQIFLLLISMVIVLQVNAQKRMIADIEKTKLSWMGDKVTGEHKGTIDLKSGWLTWQDNKVTGGEFLIDMTTIEDSEDNKKLEGHLRSDDFFGVEKYPTAKLVIKESTTSEKGTGWVKGSLTIKEDTHPVEFKTVIHEKEEGLWFYANIIIDRTDYNVRYGSGKFFGNLGDKTIFDEFKLRVNLLVK